MKFNKILYIFLICFVAISSAPIRVDAAAVSSVAENDLRVMLSSYELVEGEIKPGETITLRLYFENMNKRENAYSVIISSTASENGIYPVWGTSNQTYIEHIKAKSKESVDIQFEIDENVEDGIGYLSFEIDYLDSSAAAYKNTSTIALSIEEECKLEIENMAVTANTSLGANSLVNISCFNSGEADIYNAVLYIEGDISEEQKTIELGDISVGDTLYKDYYVTFQNVGEKELTFTFTYENQKGTTYSMEPIIKKVNINDNINLLPDEYESSITSSTNYTTIYIVALIVVSVGTLIAYTLVTKMKKRFR